jgi:hypothetical protein
MHFLVIHNSIVGHLGLQKCREFLNDPTITDRTITQFIRQRPCCQVMSRLKFLIKPIDAFLDGQTPLTLSLISVI